MQDIWYGANITGAEHGGVALDHLEGDTYNLVPIDPQRAAKTSRTTIKLKDLEQGGVTLQGVGGDTQIVAPRESARRFIGSDFVEITGTENQGVTLNGKPAEEYTDTLREVRYPWRTST